MRVLRQSRVHLFEVFVEHRVPTDRPAEVLEFDLSGQLAVDHEVADLHKAGLRGELLDRDATVPEDAFFSVDEGDSALAGPRVGVAGVERDVAGLGAELGDVDALFTFGSLDDIEFEGLVSDLEFCGFAHNFDPL